MVGPQSTFVTDVHAGEPWLGWSLLRGGPGSRPESLFHQALRTRSPAALETLVRVATRGAESADSLLLRVLSAPDDAPGAALATAALSRLQVRALAGVAMTWAGLMRSTDELEAAARIFTSLWVQDRAAELKPEHHLVAAQTLFQAGHHDALRTLLPTFTDIKHDVRHYLRADLLNPYAPAPVDGPPQRDRAAWLDLFGQLFTDVGLTPPTVRTGDGSGPAFDLLDATDPAEGSVGGELVTVVMPCYRPDRGLLTSLRSISRQTWSDLEILVVDDASGPEYDDVFAEAVSSDPRARLVRMPRNGGSYLGREAAIASSTGTLVTFQDADDWSHPKRIEHQVQALRAQDAPMSRSHAIRAKDDLTHQWLGYRPMRPNASSLLVRRDVLERCGGFLPVRKGADSEFAERIAILAGPVADTGTPLAITRLRSGSLSRGDFTFSWTTPDRLAFREGFMGWHRTLRARRDAGERVVVSTADLHALPFPVPPAWVRDLEGAARVPTRFPVAYLGNFAESPAPSFAMDQLRHHLTSSTPAEVTGPVGLWHQEAPGVRERRRPRYATPWSDLVAAAGHLRPVTRVDAVQIDLLVVVDPGVLPLLTGQPCLPVVSDVEVWLTPQVVEPGSSLLPEDLLGISDILAARCGRRPRWVLAPYLDDSARRVVTDALPGLALGEPSLELPAVSPVRPARARRAG